MQNNRAPQKKAVKFLDTKILIATLALGATIGMWNLFSTDWMKQDAASADPKTAPPPQDAVDPALAGIPTLVPLIEVKALPINNNSTTTQASLEQPAAGLPLRSVSAPSSNTIVQQKGPIFGSSDTGGGGGGGGGGKAVTRTRSSRPK